jgi:hemoglobin-like flavoprotein
MLISTFVYLAKPHFSFLEKIKIFIYYFLSVLIMDFEELFHKSYKRNVEDKYYLFFSRFYEIFIDSSEEVKEAFKNTDMNRQVEMLQDSLHHIINFASSKKSNSFLEALAVIHKGNKITENMYDLWIQAILKTLQEIDPHYQPEEGLAWRIMLSPGIEFMKGFPKRQFN